MTDWSSIDVWNVTAVAAGAAGAVLGAIGAWKGARAERHNAEVAAGMLPGDGAAR